MKYNEIIGQEHAKRAIEIALMGNHSIKFIGNEEAEELKAVCDELKIEAMAIKPCDCGNYNDQYPYQDCVCTAGELRRFYKNKKWQSQYDLTIETKKPQANKIINAIYGKNDGEKYEEMIKRVEIAKEIKVKDEIKDEQAKNLLETAIKQNYLKTKGVIFSTIAVAKTIAKLDGKNSITACAIAEALQYRPRA
jgi:predicted ATPase with chaperone activity